MRFEVDKEFKSKSGIYVISNTRNSRVYVGSSRHFWKRFRRHRNQLIAGEHHCIQLQRFCNRHGVDCLVFEVLEVVDTPTREQILSRENHFFSLYQDKFNSAPEAYSMQGFKFSEEQSARKTAAIKISRNTASQKAGQSSRATQMWADPEFAKKRSRNHLPSVQSQEYADKMSAIIKRRWADPDYRSRVLASKRLASSSDAYKKKVSEATKGESNPNVKLSEDSVRQIKLLISQGQSPKFISDLFQCSISTVKDIRKGRTWKHV